MDDDTGDLMAAIASFHSLLPGWWFTVGSCSVSRDASCGPDRNWLAHDTAALEAFDEGFHVDLHTPGSTLADALREVTAQATAALEKMK